VRSTYVAWPGCSARTPQLEWYGTAHCLHTGPRLWLAVSLWSTDEGFLPLTITAWTVQQNFSSAVNEQLPRMSDPMGDVQMEQVHATRPDLGYGSPRFVGGRRWRRSSCRRYCSSTDDESMVFWYTLLTWESPCQANSYGDCAVGEGQFNPASDTQEDKLGSSRYPKVDPHLSYALVCKAGSLEKVSPGLLVLRTALSFRALG
jgi:hypothetical protein